MSSLQASEVGTGSSPIRYQGVDKESSSRIEAAKVLAHIVAEGEAATDIYSLAEKTKLSAELIRQIINSEEFREYLNTSVRRRTLKVLGKGLRRAEEIIEGECDKNALNAIGKVTTLYKTLSECEVRHDEKSAGQAVASLLNEINRLPKAEVTIRESADPGAGGLPAHPTPGQEDSDQGGPGPS